MGDREAISRAMIAARGNADANSAPNFVAAAALYGAPRDLGRQWTQHGYCARVNFPEITLRKWTTFLAKPARPGAQGRSVPDLDKIADA